jgi:ABC-2 type transport system ATP-binding protein
MSTEAPPLVEWAVSTTELTKRYGTTTVVDALTLDIRPGEIFGLLGPNGAGKTTTILMLLGLTNPTSGEVTIGGFDPARDPLAVKERVGYLPDDVGFYGNLTGRQNLVYTARLNRLPDAESADRIDALLAEVGLTDAADRPAGEYSRGMRQRLGLADALVKDPAVLILDEPTVNIDPEGVRETLELVHRLSRNSGMTVILSSHLLHQVEQVCDRIGIFVAGRLAALGTVDELADSASESSGWRVGVSGPPDIAAYLRAVPGVASAEPDGNVFRVEGEAAFVDALLDACRRDGVTLTRFEPVGRDLDAIYHRYFGTVTP